MSGWFGLARKGAGPPGEFRLMQDRMLVPLPGPDDVVIAALAADGAQASTVISRAALAREGILPALLDGLDIAQAEARARKEAG